jgi:preprotein translocase subunit Sec61beta
MKNDNTSKKNLRGKISIRKAAIARRAGLISFSEVEDSKDAFKTISRIVARAGKNAAAKAQAAGVARVYIRDNDSVVKLSATGDEVLISPKIKHKTFYVKYKTSTILHAVKK